MESLKKYNNIIQRFTITYTQNIENNKGNAVKAKNL